MPSRRTVPAWAPATAVVALLLGVLTSLVLLPAPAARADDETTPADPLSVTIDTLTPSTLKPETAHGTVQVSGTITNDDDQTWQDINVHPFVGSTPLTTETALSEASLSDPDQSTGYHRITAYGDFETIPSIAPGQTVGYSLTIPRADLSDGYHPITTPGVYWFGIQALGTDSAGRDDAADGRARTFLPLIDPKAHRGQTEDAALVVPLRQRVLRQPDGTLARTDTWIQRLSPGGRLYNLLDFATDHPVSWLVDPAVIDAVRQLAAGNPPRSLAPTDGSSPSPSSTSSPTAAKRAAADDGAAIAKTWLDRLITELRANPNVYALPYGDLDLAAAARHDPAVYDVARQRSIQVLSALGVKPISIDAPVNGYLQPGALGLGQKYGDLLLSDQAITGTVPSSATIGGRHIITTSSLIAAGGPPPGDQLGLVPVRQELLAQSALRLGSGAPVVAVLPADWSPGTDSADFFAGLPEKWLSLTSIDGATTTSVSQGLDTDRIRYPDAEYHAELPARSFSAADRLRSSGKLLQSVLAHNDTVSTTVLDDALTSLSYTARGGSGGAAADRSRASIEGQLHSISVVVPPAVTLSSDTGKFNATVVNGLDEDIDVKVQTVSDNGIKISGPHKLQIPANSRTGVLLTAQATTNGVHTVVLQLTDSTGVPLGSEASLPIRTAQVSRIIWLFIACGVGLLFAAIVIRLVRRVRSGPADPDEDDDPDDDDPDGPQSATEEKTTPMPEDV